MAGTLKFDTWLNGDNTENYKCRAWCNFNGTGTVAIRASGNVSSITDGGTGDYSVNFTNPMTDTNYGVVASSARDLGGMAIFNTNGIATQTINLVRIFYSNASMAVADQDGAYVAIFR